jgi:signal transduction histidine kinase
MAAEMAGKKNKGVRGMDVPETRDNPSPRANAQSALTEEEFLRGAQQQVDHALFLARFSNWRISVGGAIGIAWTLAAMFHYLEPAANTYYWAALESLAFAIMGAMCFVYERRRPQAGSPEQVRWLRAWTFFATCGGLATGLLPWFIPSDRDELQLTAAAVVSILTIAFVVSRGYRPLIYAIVGGHALTITLSLALHAKLLPAVPVCLLFSAFVLAFGLMLNGSMRAAVGQRLYAQYLHTQLHRSLARQLQVQQLEATLNERRRVLSDLHDGFGTQLLTSFHLLEGGRMGSGEAAQVLRECMDDLRLMIDAHEPAARNPATLLGMLRYRLQRRVEAAGLKMHWQIGELPESDLLPSAQALDLLRILQEAISNVLQHAGARQIHVSTRRMPRQLEVIVEDDGRGFDPAAMNNGRGISGMQRRAARLRADLTIESREQGGTAVRLLLRLPLGEAAAPIVAQAV